MDIEEDWQDRQRHHERSHSIPGFIFGHGHDFQMDNSEDSGLCICQFAKMNEKKIRGSKHSRNGRRHSNQADSWFATSKNRVTSFWN